MGSSQKVIFKALKVTLTGIDKMLKKKLKEFLQNRFCNPAARIDTPVPCMNCGHEKAWMVNTKVKADFDLNIIPLEFVGFFTNNHDGICANCGLYQAYHRFNDAALNWIHEMGKDALSTFEGYSDEDVTEKLVETFNATVPLQFARWMNFLDSRNITPKNALFLRYWFGETPRLFKERYSCNISGLDISPGCETYVEKHLPELEILSGEITGHFMGDFVTSGKYDLVSSSHLLMHSCDIRASLSAIREILKHGGVFIMDAENKVAPANPFHKLYFGEFHLRNLLNEYFDEVFALDTNGVVEENISGEVIEHIAMVHPPSS